MILASAFECQWLTDAEPGSLFIRDWDNRRVAYKTIDVRHRPARHFDEKACFCSAVLR
jgi:hypothetical protein